MAAAKKPSPPWSIGIMVRMNLGSFTVWDMPSVSGRSYGSNSGWHFKNSVTTAPFSALRNVHVE